MDNKYNTQTLNQPLSYEEVEKAILTLKNCNAVVEDGIPAECLKNRPIIELLFKIYTFCFNNGIIPDRWLKGFINPIFKQGSIYEPLNCRGITLINIICKCDSFMLNNRLCAWIEGNGVLNEEQNGFRHAQSCLDYM